MPKDELVKRLGLQVDLAVAVKAARSLLAAASLADPHRDLLKSPAERGEEPPMGGRDAQRSSGCPNLSSLLHGRSDTPPRLREAAMLRPRPACSTEAKQPSLPAPVLFSGSFSGQVCGLAFPWTTVNRIRTAL